MVFLCLGLLWCFSVVRSVVVLLSVSLGCNVFGQGFRSGVGVLFCGSLCSGAVWVHAVSWRFAVARSSVLLFVGAFCCDAFRVFALL